MPSICLLYGFAVALGGFGRSLAPQREARLWDGLTGRVDAIHPPLPVASPFFFLASPRTPEHPPPVPPARFRFQFSAFSVSAFPLAPSTLNHRRRRGCRLPIRWHRD